MMDGITLLIASYAAIVATGVAVAQWKEARRIARIRKAMQRPAVKPVPVVRVTNSDTKPSDRCGRGGNMLTDEQFQMAARYLCEEYHLHPDRYHPGELDGPGMRTYEEVFVYEIKEHELFHEVMGLAIENSKPPCGQSNA